MTVDLDIYLIALTIVGGFLAGMINVLAGNGSTITLTILAEVIGLPANVANGTNRIGILAQCALGTMEFSRKKVLDWKKSVPIILPVFLGAMLGVYLATTISNEAFTKIFGILLVVLLIVILVRPKKWLESDQFKESVPKWIQKVLYFLVGIYGGFIQMGMGLFFLAIMVLVSKFRLMPANATKLFVVGLYTIVVLSIFHYKGMVDWKIGAIIATGQATGGWFMANYASRNEWMEKVAYYLLIVIIGSAIIYYYQIPSLLFY